MIRAVSDWELNEMLRQRREGWSLREIAEAHGISKSTAARAVRKPHYCEAPCPVRTPRPLCYFHARAA